MSYSIHVYRRKRKAKDGREVADKHYTAQIRFTGDHAGNYLRSTGKTSEREARIEARRIAQEIEEREIPQKIRQANGVLTVDTMFGTWFSETGKDLKSVKDVKWQMAKIASIIGGNTEVEHISNKTIHQFVQSLKKEEASAWVINRCLERLRATMNYAEDNWEIEIARFPKFGKYMQEVPDEREINLTYDEVRRIISLLPRHIMLAAAWSYYTGCRLKEMATLEWDRVFIDRRMAIVQTKSKKKDGTRKLVLTDKAIAVLHEIGIGEKGLVFDLENRRKHFEAARKTIGREDFRWHDWRHLTATHTRMIAKPDQKLIGKALGHSGTEATQRYMHVLNEEVIELLDHLPDVMPMHEPEHVLLSETAIQD